MKNIFTYGSLMFPQVWESVTSKNYQSSKACLAGFIRRLVINAEYPGIIKGNSDDIVNGVVYFDVYDDDIMRLDHFEGEIYFRESVSIKLDSNDKISAYAYTIKPEYSHVLSDKDWDVNEFSQNGIKRFISKYSGFKEI